MIGEQLVALEQPKERDVFTLPDGASLDAEEVAKFIKVHPNTARRYLRDGDIPSYLAGARRRVLVGTLREWQRKRTHSKPQR